MSEQKFRWSPSFPGSHLGRTEDGHVAAIGEMQDGRFFVNIVRDGAYVWQGYASDVQSAMAAAEAAIVVRPGDTVEVSAASAKVPADTFSLVTEQRAPVANTNPAVWDLVIEAMRARDAEGRRKYGVPLQPHNGRDMLVDAFQEALDLVVYLRAAIYERDGK